MPKESGDPTRWVWNTLHFQYKEKDPRGSFSILRDGSLLVAALIARPVLSRVAGIATLGAVADAVIALLCSLVFLVSMTLVMSMILLVAMIFLVATIFVMSTALLALLAGRGAALALSR